MGLLSLQSLSSPMTVPFWLTKAAGPSLSLGRFVFHFPSPQFGVIGCKAYLYVIVWTFLPTCRCSSAVCRVFMSHRLKHLIEV